MKFLEIFRFELTYQVRRVWTWLIFAALLVFSFLMTRDGSLAEALHDDFFLNSPFAIAKTTVVGSLIWLLVAAVTTGEAAARDVATGMHPLTYTVHVSKAQYLGGRFLAAFILNALTLLAVPIGILLAVYSPGVDSAIVGPFRPAAFITAYGFLALPNAFVATAIQFALATRSGRPMAAYLGSVLLFFMSYIVGLFLLLQGRQYLANLLDPIGVHFILSELSHLWTTIEKRQRLVGLEGTVLTNRLLWLSIAATTLAYVYLWFQFRHRVAINFKFRIPDFKFRNPAFEISVQESEILNVKSEIIKPGFGFSSSLRRTFAIAWASFRTIATSWAGLSLLAVIPTLTVLVVLDQMESNGVPLVPTTVRVVSELTGPLSAEFSRWVIVPLLIVFFAGELMWRERDAGLDEIADAMPGSEWAPFLGKFLGLGAVLVVFMALLMAAGVLAQVILGYHPDSYETEILLYLKILFGLQFPEYLLFAMLALVVHVLADQKYVGHLVAIMAYVFILISPMFGVEHNLFIYGAGPGWSYTDMRGFGPFIGPWLWFKLYWVAWALLFSVVAKLLWMRGRERSFKVRLQLARRRFTRGTACIAGVAMVLIFAIGGFIFYNTNVLNKYLTTDEKKTIQAEYERRYGQYKNIAQPQLTGTSLHVEIYPEQGQADIRGTYRLVNSSAVAIDSIHVATLPGVETGAVNFDRTALLVVADKVNGHRIYALKRPLEPGDSLRLEFEVHIAPRGFRENGIDAAVVANGTYFKNSDCFPSIGYRQSRELTNAADRRAHGLPPRALIPSLYDVEARKVRAPAIAFEAVIGTDEHQVAVAPGALRRTWTSRSLRSMPSRNAAAGEARNATRETRLRRYFHYSADAPIGNEWAFFSANYAVHETRWVPSSGAGRISATDSTEVIIRIFHHPQHTANINRMVRSIKASLDYYTKHFGSYRYRHLNVVEHPGNGTGMHADPTMIIHEEGFTHWALKDDSRGLDLPYAIVAHEMAHQWTVPYASVEGAPVMSESVAWYYGIKVVENARGPQHLQRLLNFMRYPHPYPPIRRGEPLLRGLDPYLSYRRGPFALYTLSEYLGEERVNTALRHLLEKHRPQEAPLATTLDLYGELQSVTPDSLQYLLHDLFEVNSYWELEMERATAKQTPAGGWQVTLDVQAHKVVADSAGIERPVAMREWIETGLFASAKNGNPGKLLYLQKHRIHSGRQRIIFHVPEQPGHASIDPDHLMIDLERDNNTKQVTVKE